MKWIVWTKWHQTVNDNTDISFNFEDINIYQIPKKFIVIEANKKNMKN